MYEVIYMFKAGKVEATPPKRQFFISGETDLCTKF